MFIKKLQKNSLEKTPKKSKMRKSFKKIYLKEDEKTPKHEKLLKRVNI